MKHLAFVFVFVLLGCYNKIPQPGGLTSRTVPSHSFGAREFRVDTGQLGPMVRVLARSPRDISGSEQVFLSLPIKVLIPP